jgi:hypothetical protein
MMSGIDPARDLMPENFVFMIDLSQEMDTGGFKFSKTIESIKIVLKSVPLESMFNICTFGSEHSSLFGNISAPYNEENF